MATAPAQHAQHAQRSKIRVAPAPPSGPSNPLARLLEGLEAARRRWHPGAVAVLRFDRPLLGRGGQLEMVLLPAILLSIQTAGCCANVTGWRGRCRRIKRRRWHGRRRRRAASSRLPRRRPIGVLIQSWGQP